MFSKKPTVQACILPKSSINHLGTHGQTCQLSLIQSENQAIAPSILFYSLPHLKSGFRVRKSEKIIPISTSFIYVIIEQNLEQIVPFSNLTQLPHLRLAGLPMVYRYPWYDCLNHRLFSGFMVSQLWSIHWTPCWQSDPQVKDGWMREEQVKLKWNTSDLSV